MMGLTAAGAVLAGCAAPAAQPTQPSQPAGAATAAPAGAATAAPASAATPAPAAKLPDVMQVWIQWGDNPAQLQELFNRFATANGIKVQVNAPVEEEKIIAALSGNEPPDVLVLSGPDNVGTWQREKLVAPLDDIIASSNIDLNDFFPAPLGLCKYGGKFYSLPWGTDTYALFWNKDLFEEAKLDPEKPPLTIEELTSFAEKLTIVEGGTVKQVGFIPDFSWSHNDLYLKMFGGSPLNADRTKVTLNTPEMIECLKWQQQFYTKYGADNVLKFTSALGDYMSPDQGFYAGKIAMMVDGEWQPGPNFIQKLKPELNYGVTPFPYPAAHPERKNTNMVGGTVVVIPAGAKDKAASGKLLAWMMSPQIVADEMSFNFNLPTSKKAAQDSRFHENKKFEVFLNLMSDPNASTWPVTAINAELNTELGAVEEQVLHAGADPAPLLKAAEEKLQPELDKTLGAS